MHPRPDDWKYEPQSLEGKSVMINGGSTGIGRATARLLAQEGAKVLIFARHEKELREALEDITTLGHAVGLVADQGVREDVERAFFEAKNQFGGVDILINNAAISGAGIEETPYEEMEYIVRSNLVGYLACAREAIEQMKKRGGGHIVNVGSMSADVREESSGVYVATKAAIQAWSESLRKAVAQDGIKVSLVESGAVGTDLGGVPPEKQRERQEQLRMLTAEDVAECILYCLIQPQRCDVVSVQIRPHLQII